MLPRMDWLNALLLEWSEITPPQRVNNVVLNKRIKLVKGTQSSREISSTDQAGIELRSSTLSSSSRIVSR